MYNKIIIAFALDQGFSSRALTMAKTLQSENGEIVAVHVSEPVNDLVQSFLSEENIAKTNQSIKAMMSQRLNDEKNVESVILTGNAGRVIPEYAEKVGADCIVVGAHKPGLDDFFLGSTSSRVVRHAKCSVHVLR